MRVRALPWIAGSLTVWLMAATALAQSTSPTMRERIYEKLSKAQVAADAEDYATALEILGEVQKAKDLSPYERAQLHTAFGFVSYSQENYKKAISHYKIVLQQEGLPEAMVSLTLYTLAQLQFVVEDYEGAVGQINAWLETALNPGPEPYMLLGQGYYKLERFQEALQPVLTAISIADRTGRDVQEGWYLLLRVLYFELDDWPNVLDVLETLVARFPKKEYWVQLAAAYGEAENAPDRLASYDAAYLQGFLDRQGDLVVYAQLLLQAGVPYRAATALEKGFQDGIVERTVKNLRLLSQAWTVAQEEDRAIEALTGAAELSEDGEADGRLARLYLNRDETAKAADACRAALRKGVEKKDEIHCVLGMALFEQERFDDARAAFRHALQSDDSRHTATQWIAFIDREEKRLAQLRAGMAP